MLTKQRMSMLAGAAAVASTLVAVPAPSANASPLCATFNICPTLVHLSDDGYDQPFKVYCNWGSSGPVTSSARYVYEGHNSKEVCGKDYDGVYVNSGTYLECRGVGLYGQYFWYSWKVGPGAYKITDDDGTRNCVYRVL